MCKGPVVHINSDRRTRKQFLAFRRNTSNFSSVKMSDCVLPVSTQLCSEYWISIGSGGITILVKVYYVCHFVSMRSLAHDHPPSHPPPHSRSLILFRYSGFTSGTSGRCGLLPSIRPEHCDLILIFTGVAMVKTVYNLDFLDSLCVVSF